MGAHLSVSRKTMARQQRRGNDVCGNRTEQDMLASRITGRVSNTDVPGLNYINYGFDPRNEVYVSSVQPCLRAPPPIPQIVYRRPQTNTGGNSSETYASEDNTSGQQQQHRCR